MLFKYVGAWRPGLIEAVGEDCILHIILNWFSNLRRVWEEEGMYVQAESRSLKLIHDFALQLS